MKIRLKQPNWIGGSRCHYCDTQANFLFNLMPIYGTIYKFENVKTNINAFFNRFLLVYKGIYERSTYDYVETFSQHVGVDLLFAHPMIRAFNVFKRAFRCTTPTHTGIY